ncbi:AMP-binding protein [Streptomyces sp. NPDC057740]|uniref:AMP-binding protein n=1 Tax=Streptomyces sp. NPDC057740 TaxID=3346234 RepID=UPI00367C2B23
MASGTATGSHWSCPNLPYFPVVYYGILKTGASVVPLDALLPQREVAYHLRDSQAKAYFCLEGGAELPMGERGRAAFEATPDCATFADTLPMTATGKILKRELTREAARQ